MTQQDGTRAEDGERSGLLIDVLAARQRVSRNPEPPAAPEPPSRGPGIRGGAIAGLLAGLLAGLGVVVSSAVHGSPIWIALKLASAPFFGERALRPNFDAAPLLIGIATHFAVCAGWGALFGAVFYGTTRGATVALGALWGLVVWLAMHYGFLPLLGVPHLAAILPVGVTLIGHMLFGVVLGVAFLPFQRVRRPFDSMP